MGLSWDKSVVLLNFVPSLRSVIGYAIDDVGDICLVELKAKVLKPVRTGRSNRSNREPLSITVRREGKTGKFENRRWIVEPAGNRSVVPNRDPTVSSLHNAKQQSRVQILSTSSKPLAHVRPATATVPTSSFEGNGATFVQPPPFELRKSKPPSPVSPLASVVQSLPADGSSIPHDHVGHLPRIKNHSCIRTLALGSLPPPSPGSRRLHFFFFSLFGTQVAWFVIPIFPVFSVRGLEQLAVGSPLAVALPIVVVSSVSIRVSVEGTVFSVEPRLDRLDQ
ncbi:hypothetical protein AHAS_Ahas10G0096800 [Arachis hypogaea]